MRNIFGYGSFGGRSSFMGAEPRTPEEMMTALNSFASRLESERLQDAADFQAMTQAGQRRQDLVFEIKRAEEKLATETKRWEAAHQNADALQAAQTALEAAQAQYGQAKADGDTYREAVNRHAAAIQGFVEAIQDTIASMPEEMQAEARATIEACRIHRSMKGSDLCEHGETSMGCKKCQRGRKRKQYKDPFSQMRGGFLGEISLAPVVQSPAPAPAAIVTYSPVSTPVLVAAVPAASVPDSSLTPIEIGVSVGVLAFLTAVVVFSTVRK